MPFLELDVSLPLELRSRTGSATRYGFASASIAVAARLFDARSGSWLPSVGFAPELQLPSPSGIGSDVVRAYIPAILEKSIGAWSALANLALGINAGGGNRKYGFIGVVLTRRVSGQLGLGAELFFRSSPSADMPSTLAFNVGGKYQSGSQALYFSVGRGLLNARSTNELSGYLAYQISF